MEHFHFNAVRPLRRRALRDLQQNKAASVFIKVTGRINGKFASYFRLGAKYANRLIFQKQKHKTEAALVEWATSHCVAVPTAFTLPKVQKSKTKQNAA
jgi:hypothetical protein